MRKEKEPLLEDDNLIFLELYGRIGYEKRALLQQQEKIRETARSTYLTSETSERQELRGHIEESLRFIKEHKITKVFSTVRGSIYEGFLLKEAFKNAFPNESPPKFYNVVPITLANGLDAVNLGGIKNSKEVFQKNIREFLTKRLKEGDNVWIIDGTKGRGGRPGDGRAGSKKWVADAFEDWSREKELNLQVYTDTPTWSFLSDNYRVIYPVDKGNITAFFPSAYSSNVPVTGEYYHRKTGGSWDKAKEKLEGGFLSISGTVLHDKILQKSAKANIRIAKNIGEVIGEKIREENQRRDLEGKVSGIIGVVGLGLSLFFLSGITGNVIGSPSTSNILGVALFIIGIVGAFFYFRKK